MTDPWAKAEIIATGILKQPALTAAVFHLIAKAVSERGAVGPWVAGTQPDHYHRWPLELDELALLRQRPAHVDQPAVIVKPIRPDGWLVIHRHPDGSTTQTPVHGTHDDTGLEAAKKTANGILHQAGALVFDTLPTPPR